ncbi:16S rRNA (guanine(527)-N(7))-methyltransferase RsmG [Rhodoblastus sp.]|uniref:16S rRNA (guanine(527)-N(7))-methyltransferase RsmG n=1 Tax=Rhodoblastus sp. TaxID=1962975 RepID=UPI003F9D0245
MIELTESRNDPMASLPAATIERLRIYEELLCKWQRKINLVSESSLSDIWARHFLDSYQLLNFAGIWTQWVDLGSGGGFPGLVIGIASDSPNHMVHLIEADKRKAAFLREVSRETGARIEIHVGRIERVLPELCRKTKFDVVSARALAPLEDLARLAAPALTTGALGMFLKGKDFASELTNSPTLSNFDLTLVGSQSDPTARIILLRWRDLATAHV